MKPFISDFVISNQEDFHFFLIDDDVFELWLWFIKHHIISPLTCLYMNNLNQVIFNNHKVSCIHSIIRTKHPIFFINYRFFRYCYFDILHLYVNYILFKLR